MTGPAKEDFTGPSNSSCNSCEASVSFLLKAKQRLKQGHDPKMISVRLIFTLTIGAISSPQRGLFNSRDLEGAHLEGELIHGQETRL